METCSITTLFKRAAGLAGLLSVFLLPAPARADRSDSLINHNWQFRFSHQVDRNSAERVDLPHTWNARDALSGKTDYKRGIGNYVKNLYVRPEWKGRRLFLRFEGANSVTNLFVNGRHVGEHRGGYGAFVFEITDRVKYGADNQLLVRVNNGEQLDVMPLVGDFNFYGGLYRDVHLLMTDEVCISPLDYASPGVYLTQEDVSAESATVRARVVLANAAPAARTATLTVSVLDGDRTVRTASREVSIPAGATTYAAELPLRLEQPHLWDGTRDPFLYRVVTTLSVDGEETDRVEQPLGLRFFRVDPDQGFFLNGRHLQLHGVCRHQERAEVGNALRPEHHREDVALMREMGVNAVRLAHYPQATAVYDLMDRNGIVTWAEIPFVGPGGYADKGFVDQPSFRANGREQLKELIRQHYNHPAIVCWGLFNELKEQGDNPVEYVKELNGLAHAEDSTRLTTSASNQGGALNFITDLIAWNRYDGWYGASPSTLATWLDQTHRQYPDLRIGISEYGAGASIYHQQDSLRQPAADSWWHPENWQTEYHVRNWEIIQQRPFVWGTFVWNMFDFGAAHRTEGDRPGINDKGLVTHDRKTRKDAFFFYKANWNPEPMVYIEGHRATDRSRAVTDIRVFSNCEEVTLTLNGRKVGTLKPDAVKCCTFHNVALDRGDNRIEATGRNGRMRLSDTVTWQPH